MARQSGATGPRERNDPCGDHAHDCRHRAADQPAARARAEPTRRPHLRQHHQGHDADQVHQAGHLKQVVVMFGQARELGEAALPLERLLESGTRKRAKGIMGQRREQGESGCRHTECEP